MPTSVAQGADASTRAAPAVGLRGNAAGHATGRLEVIHDPRRCAKHRALDQRSYAMVPAKRTPIANLARAIFTANKAIAFCSIPSTNRAAPKSLRKVAPSVS